MTREEAILKALAINMIDEAYQSDVQDLLELPESAWPQCCNSDCEPCVTALIRTALCARRLIAQSDQASGD